jgi:hypothetical protein
MGCAASSGSRVSEPATNTVDEPSLSRVDKPAPRAEGLGGGAAEAVSRPSMSKSLDEQLSDLFDLLADKYEKVFKRGCLPPCRSPLESGSASEDARIVSDDEKSGKEVDDEHARLASKRKKSLSDFLLAMGIGRSVDDFVNDLFLPTAGVKDEQLALSEFKQRFLDELEISLKFVSLCLLIVLLRCRCSCLCYVCAL